MNRIMLDLETLDTQPSAAIISIGAVRFGPQGVEPNGFYLPVAFDQRDGRTVSRDTIAWWLTQPAEVQAALTDSAAVPLSGALAQLFAWITNGNTGNGCEVWAGPATFDLAVLEHAYRANHWNKLPWKYNETRCYTTLRKQHPRVPRSANQLAHNALADATSQAEHLLAILWPEQDTTTPAERAPTASGASTDAVRDLLAERKRQVDEKGWDHAHDDAHPSGEIAAFAAVYAMPEAAREWPAEETGYGKTFADALCPQDWNPNFGDRRRDLVKAGALILAEIERIDRAASAKKGGAT